MVGCEIVGDEMLGSEMVVVRWLVRWYVGCEMARVDGRMADGEAGGEMVGDETVDGEIVRVGGEMAWTIWWVW